MTEQECLALMVAPGTKRPGKWRGGVIQVHITRACNLACFNCTQSSQLGGKTTFMSPQQFEQAIKSLAGFDGVIGVFGGNPATSPHFVECCEVLRRSWVPFGQRGLWCNALLTPEKGAAARATFNPAVSNLNVHLDQQAWDDFRAWWPEARPFGLREDSRHSPVLVSMRDLGIPEEERHELISRCDVNQHWSAMVCVFRGQLRAFFCEVAGAQAMLHQDEPGYPDKGVRVNLEGNNRYCSVGGTVYLNNWWELPMEAFVGQVRQHCHDCSVPLRGRGELAQADAIKDPGEAIADCDFPLRNARIDTPPPAEQYSQTHVSVMKPKRKGRRIELVTTREQLGHHPRDRMTSYVEKP